MKIWSKLFLVTATGMMMFSSCLKNIEPEGLADLRGAKAELLRAQTAVQAANAAKVEAEAALILAQAKVQEALAKQAEAKAAYDAALARLQELEVEKQTTLNQIEIEQAIAAAKAEIAKSEADAAKAAADAEEYLLNVLKRVAVAQAEYESALKDLALAAAYLTPAQQTTLTAMQDAVTLARNEVNSLIEQVDAAAVELAYALAQVDSEAIIKTAVRKAEAGLVAAQAALEGAVEAEAVAKAALELDPSVTDWEAKVEEYKAEIEKLDSEWLKKNGEITDAMSAMEDSIKVEASTPKGVIAVKAADYTKYTGYKFFTETGVFSNLSTETKTPIDIKEEYAVAAPKTADGDAITGVDNFKLTAANYTYGEEATVVEEFENALKNLAKVNVASYEANIAAEEAIVEASKNNPEYKYNVERYNDAVAAYNAGDVVPYFTEYVFAEDYDLAAAVKEYNDAVAVLDAAVEKYHSELDKYSPDFSEETQDALAAKNEAVKAAATVKYTAYQKAYDDHKVAAKNAQAAEAYRVKNNAQDSYDDVETAAKAATLAATVEEIKDFVKNYDAATADDATKAKYEVWSVWNAKIVAAESTLTNANKAYEDAVKAATKADDDYTAAKATADEAYEKAVAKADEEYNKAIAAIAEKATGFDSQYKAHLEALIMAAATDLISLKMPAVTQYAGQLTSNTTPVDVVVSVKNPSAGPPTYTFPSVPAFMVDGTYDGTTSYAFKAIAVADFVDKEHFKKTEIANRADALVKIGSNDFEYVGYPLVMPSDDEASDYYELNSSFVPMPSFYADIKAADKIAGYEAAIEALGQLPDFVKAIEAAQAKFEAFVAEKAAEFAADKAEVEAFYARYLPLKEKNDTELDAIKAKNDVLKARYSAMVQVIADYCYAQDNTTTTVDALVTALREEYKGAVAELATAEKNVYAAEITLEQAKSGVVTGVELAQRRYDALVEDLAIAMAKLEGATIALENAIAVIYGVEPVVPETPDTPDTPEGGDDTTDEGGEAEGGEGEAEGGEGEGGEETPAE